MRLRRAARRSDPEPPGELRLGSLRRLTPISDVWGLDRGSPIDRYYIEGFLDRHAEDIRGRVLEVNDDRYTQRFGGERVERSDILHPYEGNPAATVVADLAGAPQIAGDSFDCVICTQTLQYVFESREAVATLRRIVSPGGVVLASVPGTSRLTKADNDAWGDWWRFTTQSITRLFEEAFEGDEVAVEAHGNVLTAAAQLYGIAAEELTTEELDHRDPNFEVVLTVRARRR
jgi:SAM-dependent methyltransferase